MTWTDYTADAAAYAAETETLDRAELRDRLAFHHRRRAELAAELRAARAKCRAAWLTDGLALAGGALRGLNLAARALAVGYLCERVNAPTRPTVAALTAEADRCAEMAARPCRLSADELRALPCGDQDAIGFERDSWREAAAETRALARYAAELENNSR